MKIGIGLGLTNLLTKPTVVAPAAPVNTGIPVITGLSRVGETAVASTGIWTGNPAPTFAFQWKIDGINVGTNSEFYEYQEADEDGIPTVTVVATNASGSASATSDGAAPVAALGEFEPGPFDQGGFDASWIPSTTGAVVPTDNPGFRRYIRKGGSGNVSGTSVSNAGRLSQLASFVAAGQAAGGGKIYLIGEETRLDESGDQLPDYPVSDQAVAIVLTAGGVSVEGVDINLNPRKVIITGGGDKFIPPTDPSSTVTLTVGSPGTVTWPGHTLYNGQPIRIETTGNLLTGLVAGDTYFVRNSNPAAGTFQLSGFISDALIAFTGTQSGTHTCIHPFEELTDVRGMSRGRVIFYLRAGASNLAFKNIVSRDTAAAWYVQGLDLVNLTFDGCDVINGRRSYYFSQSSGTQSISGVTIKNFALRGFSKDGMRLSTAPSDSSNFIVEDGLLDSMRQDGDASAECIALRGTHHNIILRRLEVCRAHDEVLNYGQPDIYYNGDGLIVENTVYNLLAEDIVSWGHTDAGLDIKSGRVLVKNLVSYNNKINFKCWGSTWGDTDLEDSTLVAPRYRGGSGDYPVSVQATNSADLLVKGGNIIDFNPDSVSVYDGASGTVIRVYQTTEYFAGANRTRQLDGFEFNEGLLIDLTDDDWSDVEAPVLTTPTTFTVPEEQELRTTVAVHKPDCYFSRISLPNTDDRELVPLLWNGTMLFYPKQHELPSDRNEDNVYVTAIRARDRRRNQVFATLTVTVEDVPGEVVVDTRWVSSAKRGDGTGTSYANAATIDLLDGLIALVPPGGFVNIVNDGIYSGGLASLVNIRKSYGTAEDPVTVRGTTSDGTPCVGGMDPYYGSVLPGNNLPIIRGTRTAWTPSPDPEYVTNRVGATWAIGTSGFNLYAGAQHIIFTGLRFERMGEWCFAFREDGANNILIDNNEAFNVRRFVDQTGGTEPHHNTITNNKVVGFSKQAIRTRGTAHDYLIADNYLRSGRLSQDAFAVGIAFSEQSHDILLQRNVVKDCHDEETDVDLSTRTGFVIHYQNGGDGYSTENGNYNITFDTCEAYDCTDGGFDCKGFKIEFYDCLSSGSKKNYRYWGGPLEQRWDNQLKYVRCTSIQPKRRGAASPIIHFSGATAADALFEDCVMIDDGIAGDPTRFQGALHDGDIYKGVPYVTVLYTFAADTTAGAFYPCVFRIGSGCVENTSPTIARFSAARGSIFYEDVDTSDATLPVFTLDLTPTVNEHEATVFSLTADEPCIFYVTGGADADHFIPDYRNSDLNVPYMMTSLTLPGKSFAAPDDADGDGVYEIEVEAVDRNRNRTRGLLEVSLANVVEADPAPETTALVARMTAVGATPDSTRQGHIDTYVKSLKDGFGPWLAIKDLRVFAAPSIAAARVNWKADTALVTEHNSPTFTADRGYKGDGYRAYVNHNIAYAGLDINSLDVGHFVWSLSNAEHNGAEFGANGSDKPFGIGRGMAKWGASATISVGAPGVVTAKNHGQSAGNTVSFAPGSGAVLPGGVTKGKTYYIIEDDISPDLFKFSETLDGPPVTTTGTQDDDDVHTATFMKWALVGTSTGSGNWGVSGLGHPADDSLGFYGFTNMGLTYTGRILKDDSVGTVIPIAGSLATGSIYGLRRHGGTYVSSVTIQVGTPGIVHLTDHGRTEGSIVTIAAPSGSTLPGGILAGAMSATTGLPTSGQSYYVRNPTRHTFNLSTTADGPLVAVTSVAGGNGVTNLSHASTSIREVAMHAVTKKMSQEQALQFYENTKVFLTAIDAVEAEGYPTITSPASYDIAENVAFSQQLTATETVTWTKTGGADAAIFTLTSGGLLTAAAQDFEADSSLVVEVTATDVDGNATPKTITLNVTNVAEVTLPDLTLSASSVAESASIGTTVGTLTNKTSGSTVTMTDTAGGRFTLDGTAVKVAGVLDYESATSHNITLRETSSNGVNSPHDTVKTITVTDTADNWFDSPQWADAAVVWDFNNDRYAITTVAIGDVPTASVADLKIKREATFAEIFTFTTTATTARTYIAQDTTLKNDLAANVARFTWRNSKRQIRLDNVAVQLLHDTATLPTQTVTVVATAHTFSFTGTGSVALSGASTAGPLVGTGANNRVTLTFTPTAGSLTLTTTGDVRLAQLETGPFASSYIPNTAGSGTVTRALEKCLFSPIVQAIAARAAASVVIRGQLDFNHNGSTSRALLGNDHATVGLMVFPSTTTTIQTFNGTNSIITSSLGAAWYKSPFGAAWGFDGTGRSLVGNGGTVVSDANAAGSRGSLTLGSLATSTAHTFAAGFYDNGMIAPERLSNAQLQALAVAA